MADLDRFKNINDRYGHIVGDEVLREFANRARASIRQGSDWIARFGGEEFVIVLPETPLVGATATAEKVRNKTSGNSDHHECRAAHDKRKFWRRGAYSIK